VRDFDLLAAYPECSFGTTLVFVKQANINHWEPGAATARERGDAIKLAHEMGIKTWVSIEPVIDPEQALSIIHALHRYVDHWKIGKINGNPTIENAVDWVQFKADVEKVLKSVNADYYLKNSLRRL